MCWVPNQEPHTELTVHHCHFPGREKFCLKMCWVNKFSDVPDCEKFFLDGQTPNLPGILDGGTVQNQNRYKPICQLFNNIYRFATLYDTTNRIPVFSAYNFTGPGCNRTSQTWMIEPQLENFNIKEMKTQQELKMLNNKTDIRVDHQAADADYSATISSMDLDRGHLFPCKATPDDDTMRSTFTLTNAVPQERGFNRGRWCKMEGRFRVALMNCKNNNNQIEAYVVTGAVPNNNNVILNNKVNVPDLLWTAFCCYNNKDKKWMAGAYWGENKKDNGKILNLETLRALEVKLTTSYNVDIKVFHDKCPRKVNVQQVESVEEEPGKKTEGSGEGSNKMERTSGELKERDVEDRCDCDCDEK
ncbi:endonuclease domain-containing 1 protein-like isoform X1 [Salvelinus fontinalis]|uniref:endonuclease domain-containing 1 protein-like isoform X1 n=2 Tax=Salvelinus fontinalis TaxID=8038 RepID=UPI002485313D|nr:endonuclease domain-containing 1 protein-like isoform X1 [Salvelinus fontinalis]